MLRHLLIRVSLSSLTLGFLGCSDDENPKTVDDPKVVRPTEWDKKPLNEYPREQADALCAEAVAGIYTRDIKDAFLIMECYDKFLDEAKQPQCEGEIESCLARVDPDYALLLKCRSGIFDNCTATQAQIVECFDFIKAQTERIADSLSCSNVDILRDVNIGTYCQDLQSTCPRIWEVSGIGGGQNW